MRKDRLLRGLVALQAVCMIVLAVVVTSQYVPLLRGKPADRPEGLESNHGGPSGGTAAGMVGGQPITQQQLDAELRRRYGDATLRMMMLRQAVQLEAEASGIAADPELVAAELSRMMEGYESEADYYEAMKSQLGLTREDVQDDVTYRLLLEQIATRAIHVTDDQIDIYLDEHAEELAAVKKLRLRWILMPARADAEEIAGKLRQGEDFAALAKAYSIDAYTADNGGDLGLIEADDPFVEAALLEAAQSLEVGERTGPVKTEGGYAIIRLDERREQGGLAGEHLREEARRRVALELAEPLPKVEDELLAKYGASLSLPAQ